MTPRQCGELTADGSACKSNGPFYNDGFCGWHSSTPEAAEWRDKMRVIAQTQGLKSRKPRDSFKPDEVPPPPQTLDDLKQWSSWAVFAVATGQLNKDPASKVVTAIAEMRRVIGAADHEKRIARLEDVIRKGQISGL